ncbi:MAG TPA: hypothetical protein VNF99_09980 [Stellaceae bacterium]|nr:hypothetical protein [Stellaceae bacterium]
MPDRDALGRLLPPDPDAAAQQRQGADRIAAVLTGPAHAPARILARAEPRGAPQPQPEGKSELTELAEQVGVVIKMLVADRQRIASLEERTGDRQQTAASVSALRARVEVLEGSVRQNRERPVVTGVFITGDGELMVAFGDGSQRRVGSLVRVGDDPAC